MSALVLAGVIVTGAWTQLDEIGWAGWLPLVLVLALDRYAATSFRWRRLALPPSTPPLLPLIACAAICSLLLAHVAITAREEFGFNGDEGYHLSATRTFALYFMRAGPFLVGTLVVFGVLRFTRFQYAATIAMALLLASSYLLPGSALFGRYPTGFYLLATPLSVAFEAANIPYPITANHIVNVLSVPVWLFVLRPFVIGRWPDWRVLPVALLVYFQAPAFVYVSSALLEPWALVFLLLSVEAVAAFEPDERWMAVPLAAVATFFKETAILLLPTVWLLACVEWRGFRPSIRRGAVTVGVASVAPFLIYYAVRRSVQIERVYEIAGIAGTWSSARVSEWLINVRANVGVGGMLAIAAAMAWSLRPTFAKASTFAKATVDRTVGKHIAWIVTALLVALFFFADAASIAYTGYGRFLAYSLVALCGAVFASAYRVADQQRAVVAFCAVIALLQLPAVAGMFTLDFQPDYERNSLEWNRSLIRLPVRTLAEKIATTQGGEQVRRIRMISFGTDLISLRVAYPDLAERFDLQDDEQSAPTPDCRCRDNSEAVIAGFEWPVHFGDTPEARTAFDQVSAACVSQIETTCLSRTMERHRSGAIVGAMGVGRVLLIAVP
jgi:hypothetical protein